MSKSKSESQQSPKTQVNLNPQLQKALDDYCQFFQEDSQQYSLIFDLLSTGADLQDRKNMDGHLSSQGFLFNQDFSKALLLHHKMLDIWLQPGGHMDPEDTDLVLATQREVLEETGLLECSYIPVDPSNPPMPISVAINDIPANPKKQESEHVHIDLAYIFQTSTELVNIDLLESNQFRWISFAEFADTPRFALVAGRVRALCWL